MSKQIIAVFGATGAQGGSVVRHLLAQGRFRVRALTRRPEVYAGPADERVRADLNDPEGLSEALKGAYGVFLVTDFWQAGTDERAQATAAVEAARAAGVEHLVWSSLPDVSALSNGRRDVPHFTGKAQVEPVVRAAGFPSYTFVQPPFYFENLSGMMGPQPMPDGRKGWVLPIDPDARVIDMGSVADLGQVVAGAFADPARSRGQTFSMAAGRYSFSDVMRAWSQATGEPVAFQRVPAEVFAGFHPHAGELAEMLAYFEEYTYMGPDSEQRIEQARAIATGPLTSLETFLQAQVGQRPRP